jgi:hypothetical protein
MHVASGVPWQGHTVREARSVLYVMDEGMHDFGDRWAVSSLWDLAKDRIFVVAESVNLLSTEDVKRLIDEYLDVRPGLVIFDTIYGMGMPDDMGVKEVAPVVNSLKTITAAWDACTLAIGHAGHNGERRFRGSSMWRQRTDVDWHMAESRLSCERSKIANKHRLGGRYELRYPHIHHLGSTEQVLSVEATRLAIIRQHMHDHPTMSAIAHAKALQPNLGISARTISRYIKHLRESDPSDDTP